MSKGITKPSNQSGRAGFLSDVIVELGMADATTSPSSTSTRPPPT